MILCTREKERFGQVVINKSFETHLICRKRQTPFEPNRILTLFLFARSNIISVIRNYPQLSLRAFFLLFFCDFASVQTSRTQITSNLNKITQFEIKSRNFLVNATNLLIRRTRRFSLVFLPLYFLPHCLLSRHSPAFSAALPR